MALGYSGNLGRVAPGTAHAVWPAEPFQAGSGAVLVAILVDQLHEVHIAPYFRRLLSHQESSMPRRKKPPHEMTNDELLRAVFPKEAVPKIRKEALGARKPQVRGPKRSIKRK